MQRLYPLQKVNFYQRVIAAYYSREIITDRSIICLKINPTKKRQPQNYFETAAFYLSNQISIRICMLVLQ